MKAINLVPSSDFAQVELALKQTLAGADILRIKGQLPLTDFTDVRPSTKRLRIKANLNAKELGNLLLVLALANEINEFFTNTDEEKLDLTVISPILAQLEVPQSLYATLNRSLDFDGEVLDAASSELSHLRHELKSNDAEIKDRMDGYIKGSSSKYLSEQIVTIRDERYVIPVKQEYRNKFMALSMTKVPVDKHYLLSPVLF